MLNLFSTQNQMQTSYDEPQSDMEDSCSKLEGLALIRNTSTSRDDNDIKICSMKSIRIGKLESPRKTLGRANRTP
jgi:hypothetical protein